ncbi:MAG TPA: aldehyde dehydrogenase family protein [Kofleriaceae bacterium]|nr:aldehyde dehydrogenase family protein [Kofleriaceae bacterium]
MATTVSDPKGASTSVPPPISTVDDAVSTGARISSLFARQRANQAAVKRTTAAERIAKLERLRAAIVAREPEIRDAMYADFKKSATEVDLTEIYPVLVDIKEAIRHLPTWMKPAKAGTPMSLFGTSSTVHYEPRGVVLIIGPWNYPFQLVIAPLVAAIAAGNCAIVKPSELTSHTSRLLGSLLGDVFNEDEVAVVEGGPVETQQLLALPFDHFFFTGSTRVGRIVAEAAARHLASTTLELGGKSPAIIDDSAELELTARRLVWGKFVNAGQTCIAPDYILVSERNQQPLVDAIRKAIADLYGASEDERKASPDLCRIINARNFDRLEKLLAESVAAGAKVEIGGGTDAAERYIAPTVLSNVTADHAVMSEEIFGPILPVLTYKSFDEVAPFVTARDKPLALYVFGKDQARISSVLSETTAGGSCVNNTLIHFVNHNLPFGGVGPSGQGSYHGFYGFKAFSHERAVLRQGRADMLKQVYPPYNAKVAKMIGWMRKLFT